MPRLTIGEIEIGVSPLLQWLLLPPVALYLARRSAQARKSTSRQAGC
jgi:hypothetical protein